MLVNLSIVGAVNSAVGEVVTVASTAPPVAATIVAGLTGSTVVAVAVGIFAVRVARASTVVVSVSLRAAVAAGVAAVAVTCSVGVDVTLASTTVTERVTCNILVGSTARVCSNVAKGSVLWVAVGDGLVATISVSGCSVGLGGIGGFCVDVDSSSANSPANSSENAAVRATTSSLPILRRIG